MWQRKQTLFLIGSIIAVVLCLFFPVGYASVGTLGSEIPLNNLGWAGVANAVPVITAWPLFIFMVLAGIVSVVTIFLFKDRKLQMRLCYWGVLFDILWYVYYLLIYFKVSGQVQMGLKWAVAMPLVSIIFLLLAHKGVKADEKLVRSMDRIR